MARRRSRGGFRRLLLLIVLCLLIFGGVAAFRVGPAAEIEMQAGMPGIGKRTPFAVSVREPKRGLSQVRIELQQGERVMPIDSRDYTPLSAWQFWGERSAEDSFSFELGSEIQKELKEGSATLRVIAERAGAMLRFPQPAVREFELQVKLRPPSLHVTSSFTYVTQGGSEAVVYTVGESAVEDGVQAGERWFPGYPLPGGSAQERFALFSAPYDLDEPERIRLVARDDVGNESRAAFVDQFKRRPPRKDTIQLSDEFMGRVVPAIMAQTPGMSDRGDLLQNYLAINGELRAQNDARLRALAAGSRPEFLWKQEFMQMRNAAVKSDFADKRTYLYDGNAVDHQDHLGFDLASTRAAPIEAANDGVVVLSEYFGIYGNAVVIDHGYGLMSLYGHLSSLAVEVGAQVERGQELGRSGATGLAGGDHLHFTMLIHGLPVDPREWWDAHWIHDRLKLKLARALPFEN